MNASTSKPWWRYGLVWMIVLGPALVVVAGLVTVYVALQNPEVILDTRLVDTDSAPKAPPLTPAMAARNHAATPDQDQPGLKNKAP